jgi:membrane protein implicated in regulation of membrane protease activity
MTFYIYLACFTAGLAFAAISAFFGHIGGGEVHGSHGEAETGADGSDDPGISAFSPIMIACFLTVFGGLGLILTQIKLTSSPLLSAPIALAGGIGIASVLLQLLRKLFVHVQSSSESKVGSLVGIVGDIITPIPEGGVGEIAYVQSGSRYTAPAREANGQRIPAGKAAKIVKIVGTQFYVTVIND